MKRSVRCAKFLLLCLASVASAATASPQSGGGFARPDADGGGRNVDEAGRQTKGAADEKQSRTPAQRKLDSQLLYALRQKRGETRGVPTARIELKLDAQGRVLVDISANVTPRLLSKIGKLGGKVISKFEEYHTIRARVGLDRLETLAALEDVRFIAPAARAATNGAATR